MSDWLAFQIAICIYIVQGAMAFKYTCNSCGLSNIPPNLSPETTQLHLHGNQIKSISRNSLRNYPNITVLAMSRNTMTNVEVDSFAGMKISNLVLSYNQLTSVPDIAPLALSLRNLDLRKNRITTIEPYAFTNFTALSTLYLHYNSITNLPGFALNIPRAWLYAVHLEANGLATTDDLAFAGLGVMYLRLHNNALTEFPCLKDISMLHYLYLNSNPISIAPVECGPRWNTFRLVQIRGTLLTSVDNITKYATSLYHFEVGGTPVTFSDETFKGTRFSYITLRDVSFLPEFHSSKLTLGYLELGGVAVRCVDDVWLDGMPKLGTFVLIDTSVDHMPNPGCSNNTYENRTAPSYFQSLRNLRIHNSPLVQFPNLTAFGYNGSLYDLYIRKSKIASVPCFPDDFKLYDLYQIDLIENQINHLCSLNFAPNVRNLLLSNNPLFDTLFIEPTNIPLSNLYLIQLNEINMESLTDSVLRVAYNCGVLQGKSNKINSFPNIKLIASSVEHIELQSNFIPAVPCTAIDQMEKLTYLNLEINAITYVCPRLITQAAKLATLNLHRNQLVEIVDFRGPTRMQPTRVWLTSNPWRCLTAMCWMLFIPEDSNLDLGLQSIQCLDVDDIGENMIAGLTKEWTCKFPHQFSQFSE